MAAPVWLVLGPPASGKGTQSERLARRLDAAHLSSGQALRDTKNPAILARLATGDLARTEHFLEVVAEALAQVDPDRPVVLDSVGRMLPEAEWLVGTLQAMGRELQMAIYIDVSAEESEKRAQKRGREDDSQDAHAVRWQRFEAETRPVIEFYRAKGLLEEVDGSGTIDEVAERIEAALARSNDA